MTEPIGLYNFGVNYLDVARAAATENREWRFNDPFEFLISHGLELIFKADASRELGLNEIKTLYGHSLPKLFENLSDEFRRQFDVSDELKKLVDDLDIGHSGPEWRNRYLVTGLRPVFPVLSEMIQIVEPFNLNDRRWLSNHFVRQVV